MNETIFTPRPSQEKILETLLNASGPLRLLPLKRQSSADSLAARAAPRTILVVDDNRDMVGTTCEVLALLGYAAIPAYSAREACDVLDEARNIDLVLSDIRMPDVDGFDLLRVLRHRYRSLPVILMSGLPLTDEDIIPPGASILQKPFISEELQRLVQQKLKAPPEGL